MNKTLFAVGIFAMMISVSPAFAMDAQTDHFTVLDGISDSASITSAPMNDSELAAIEGQASPFLVNGQAGLVNVNAQVAVGAVRVIRDITIQDVNVQILGGGPQQ